ncbi:MAG: alanine--tRNA ligase-related protein, partial [Pseudomonadota bacterium]
SLPGETAFRLYDTYGFPLDLTQDALRSYGREVDLEGFDKAMERQRQAARQNWKGSGADGIDPIWFELRELHGPTEFLGYDSTVTEAILSAIVSEGATVTLAGSGSDCTLVTNQTPFYAESGGQVGDTGTIVGPDFELEVIDTRKVVGDLWLHFCTVRKGTARVDTTVSMSVDANRRLSLRRAHSATHLLHQALRRHLGNHVAQRGSLVAPDRLRFDFSHKQPLSNDELQTIEREVNLYARQNDEVTIRHMARDEAIEGGAIALFGEKYGDEVRVVTMGHRENGEAYSTELCGGTHAARTGDIAIIKLINESAVASGIRRIEAVTGEIALKTIEETEEALQGAALLLKVQPEHVAERIDTLLNERRRLEREITDLRRQAATGGLDQTAAIINYGDISFVSRSLQGVPAKELRGTADTIRKELRSGVVALVSEFDGKAAVIVSVTEDLTNRLNAVELVKQGVSILGGKGGGGRPDFAQGGGPDPSRATEALDAIEAGIAKITTR